MAKVNGKARSKDKGRKPGRKAIQYWTPKKKAEFLVLISLGMAVAHACEKVGMSRTSAYQLREVDPDFSKLWADCYDSSTEVLESECYRRAKGWEEERILPGGVIHTVEKYDNLLLMFLLKARKPKMYRDQVDVNINEKRHILLELVQLEKDEATGRLMMVDEAAPPRLTSGEGNDG